VTIGGASSFLDEVEDLGICWLWSMDELEVIVVHGKDERNCGGENVGMRNLDSALKALRALLRIVI
jgi:hypothetical protein